MYLYRFLYKEVEKTEKKGIMKKRGMKKIKKRMMAFVLLLMMLFSCSATAETWARATEKLSTRSGPGTQYRDTGSYDLRGQWVKILSCAYDKYGTCWVECEILDRKGDPMWLYTGLKRFDPSSYDRNEIEEEMIIGLESRATRTSKAKFGPGTNFTTYKELTVDKNQRIQLIKVVGDWVQVEWKTSKRSYRAWIPCDAQAYEIW